jgi:hypothetical protein
MAAWAALFVLNAFNLGDELSSGDITWWSVAWRLLLVVVFGFALYSEWKKPKAEQISR